MSCDPYLIVYLILALAEELRRKVQLLGTFSIFIDRIRRMKKALVESSGIRSAAVNEIKYITCDGNVEDALPREEPCSSPWTSPYNRKRLELYQN